MRIHSFLEHWGLINFHVPKPYAARSNDFAPPGHLSHYRKRLYEILRPFCSFCGFICDVVWYTSQGKDFCAKCLGKGYVSDATEDDLANRYDYQVNEDMWDCEKEEALLVTLKEFGEDWDKVCQASSNGKQECIAKLLSIPIEKLIEVEDRVPDHYEYPLYQPFNDPPLSIDMKNAVKNAKDLMSNEEALINNLLNKMNELLLKSIETKARFVKEMNDITKMKTISYKLKLQQLYNKQFSYSTN